MYLKIKYFKLKSQLKQLFVRFVFKFLRFLGVNESTNIQAKTKYATFLTYIFFDEFILLEEKRIESY